MQYLICTCVRNEQHRMAEWIDYHLRLGFSKIHVWCDNCTDDTAAVSTAVDKRVDVHITSPSGAYSPPSMRNPDLYNTAEVVRRLLSAWQATYDSHFRDPVHRQDWILFIDPDEFLIPEVGQTLQTIFSDPLCIRFPSYDFQPVDLSLPVIGQRPMRWSDESKSRSLFAERCKTAVQYIPGTMLYDVHYAIKYPTHASQCTRAKLGHFREHPYHNNRQALPYDVTDSRMVDIVKTFPTPHRWQHLMEST